MDFNIRHIIKFVTTILLAVSLFGCTSLEDHMNRGIAHYDAGHYEKAALEFKNVLKQSQNNVDARYQLALTEEKLGHWKSAFFLYGKITQSDPKHVMARIRLAELNIAAKHPDTALKLADELEMIDPDNLTTLLLRAKAYALKDDLKQATEYAKTAFDTEQKKSPSSALLLTGLYARQNENKKSIVVLEKSIKHNPGDLRLQLLLVNFYLNQGSEKEAKQLLEKINKSPTEKANHRINLAQLYTRMDMLDEAERVLRTAVVGFPDLSVKIALIKFLSKKRTLDSAMKELLGFLGQLPDKHQLRFILAELYVLDGQTDKAESAYRRIIGVDKLGPDGLKARRKLTPLLMKAGDNDGAKTLIDEVLMQDPLDHEARLIRATLYVSIGDLELSLAETNKLLKRAPDWLPALRLLADIHLKNKKPQLAEEVLQRAANAYPKDIGVQLKFATLMDVQGNTTGAIQQLETAQQHSPNHPRILEAMIKLKTKAKDWDGAKKTIALYKATYPDTSAGYYLAGMMYQAMGDVNASRKEFEISLQLQPTAQAPFAELIKGYIAENKSDLAIARIQKAIKDHSPAVFAYELLGEVQQSEKRYTEAEAAFRKAIDLQPNWSIPYVSLGDMLLQSNRPQEALSVYRQGIEKSSNSIAVHLKLCMAYEYMGQYDLAVLEYEKLLMKDPAFDIATNNLAMLLINHNGDKQSKERAMELVQRFTDSDVLVFKDTLAWVHYKNGMIDTAISYLRDIVEKSPQVQEFHYHLGMALHKKGYKKLARLHLEKALQDKPNYHGVEDARATLSAL